MLHWNKRLTKTMVWMLDTDVSSLDAGDDPFKSHAVFT